jgi:hypothetical protein
VHLTAYELIACALLAGCDGVFGLQHINDPIDATPTGCPTATGASVTKLFGGRPAGVLADGVADTFLSSDASHVGSNFGALDKLFVCAQCSCSADCESISGGDDDVVTLLRFDLGTEIPPCSSVDTVTLYLHTTSDELGSGSAVAFSAMLEAWDEGSGSVPAGVGGAASWQDRRPGTAWIGAGAGAPGSRAGSSFLLFASRDPETDYPITLGPAIVQGWVNNPATNHGVALVVEGSTSEVHFYSSEAPLAITRPALEVSYRLP